MRRQVRLEGGFQGRTNKLVDSCYSFWQVQSTLIHILCRINRYSAVGVKDRVS